MTTQYRVQIENSDEGREVMWFVPMRDDGSLDRENRVRVSPPDFVKSEDD